MALPLPTPVPNPTTSNPAYGSWLPQTKPRYWEWLQGIRAETRCLPWCHSTDGFALREILETGRLLPRRCPVFQEDLTYLFYGRPAYRSTEASAIGIAARDPVVLVLAPEIVRIGVRLYPFDSGAFHGGRYAKWMHRGMKLGSFELPPNLQAAERHVTAFFRSNDAYMSVKAARPDPMPAGEYEVDSLANFLMEPVAEPADDRRCALELLVREPVFVGGQFLRAMIIPSTMEHASYVREFQGRTANRVEILTYRSNPLKQANELQCLLEDRVFEFYRKGGML